MRLTANLTLGLVISISAHAADQGSGPSDRFAAYDRAINQQLSAILQKEASLHQPPAQDKLTGIAPAQQPSTGADETSVFATQFWGGRNADLTSALKRLQSMRPALEGILESEGVPKELVAVVLIESAAQPYALSPRQARGLWQLIPETARQYGLHVGPDHDERVEIERATRAAARYLRDLHRRFEDWPLALAAYNAGQSAVEKAMQQSRATSFRQLSAGARLPEETRKYVPAVLAAMSLIGSDMSSLLITPQQGTAKSIYATMAPTN